MDPDDYLMEPEYFIALLIGVIGSAVIHLSQGLLKLSIVRRQSGRRSRGNQLLYGLGLLLNFSAPLWVIAANRFGPTVLYTSMYATGLLWLMLFTCLKLGRNIHLSELAGALLLIIGSTVLVFGFTRDEMSGMQSTSPVWLLGAALLFGLAVWPAVRLAGSISWIPLGIVMGGFGGVFLALDSLLKGVAQADGGVVGFFPVTGIGWALFIFSFIGAAAALGMTQWAHARGQPPTTTIAAYDALYVTLPVLILQLANGEGRTVNALCLLGLALIVSGLLFIGKTKLMIHSP